MNESTIAALQVRRVLLELERERLGARNNPRTTNSAEILYAKFQAAIVEQIGDFLVCIPSLAFDQTRKAPKILQLYGFMPIFPRVRPVAEHVRTLLAAILGPGGTASANLLVEAFISRRNMPAIAPQRILHGDQPVSRVQYLIEIRRHAKRRKRAID